MEKKPKFELAILIGSITVLVFLLVMANKPNRVAVSTTAPFKSENLPLLMQKNISVQEDISPQRVEEVTYTGRLNRDPLDNSVVLSKIAAVAEKKEVLFPKEKFLVNAIIWGSKMPQAIINDKVVGIGEMLDGGKIIGIDKEGVHVSCDGKEVLLSIK